MKDLILEIIQEACEVKVIMYLYEMDEFLTINLDSRENELDDMLLDESNDVINREIKEK